MPRFASIVPAIRTVHGVDVFDYRVAEGADLQPGDIVRMPFRKKTLEGMVVALSGSSPVADKAVDLGSPAVLLRAGKDAAALLAASAARCFCPRPTVLASWLRGVPKRAAPQPVLPSTGQSGLPLRQPRYAIDRLSATVNIAREAAGQVLVLVPWQERAAKLAADLEASCLHAEVSAGRAWKAVQGFATRNDRILVATRVGAWLSVFADTVIVDEPENDDHKQDELTPRLDARWTVTRAAALKPSLSVLQVSTTPAVADLDADWDHVPDLEPVLTLEALLPGSRSKIESLTLSTLTAIEASVEEGRPVLVVHPVRGERARFTCRDCGWIAPCPNCGFVLSRLATGAVCRKCGKRSPAPAECAKCGGLDLSRSKSGGDRLAAQLAEKLGPGPRVLGLTELWHADIPAGATVVVTDIALVGGAVEDIRRKERLVIAFRRLAALCQSAGASLIVQGDERLLAQCHAWLSATGLHETWDKERSERALFGYPPARRVAKFLVDGSPDAAMAVYDDLVRRSPDTWTVSPPLPVPYRPVASSPRHCLQVSAPPDVPEEAFDTFLQSFAGKAIIDLDPIAFFS